MLDGVGTQRPTARASTSVIQQEGSRPEPALSLSEARDVARPRLRRYNGTICQ
jgi:hypothetical protein